jgi:hypothetical protein
MEMNNAHISLTGMLHKKQFILSIIISVFALILCSCNAATKPYTLRDTVPDGPPEYQAGWHDGCQTALSTGAFYNARSKFTPNLGSGIYQHDSAYNTGYTWGFNVCMIQNGNFGVGGGSFGGIIGAAPLE